MTFEWWQYAVAWGTVILVGIVIFLAAYDFIGWISGHFNRQGSTYNDYLVQQLYAENVNVRPGDPTTPEYGATHNAWQDIHQQRRRR